MKAKIKVFTTLKALLIKWHYSGLSDGYDKVSEIFKHYHFH